jgi:hypothetical protein
MPVSVRNLGVRLLSLLVLATMAVLLPAALSGANPKQGKEYQMFVESPEWAGVTDGSYTVTLTNTTGTQQLGSANITVPSAITIVDRNGVAGSGQVLELRSLALAPGASATVTLGLRMPCVAGSYAWSVEAKQSNDFSGPPGNSLGPVSGTLSTTVQGSCKLRFVDQPASAERNAQIRADAFQPTSTHFVTVEAIDGSPAPQRLTWFTAPIALNSVPAALPTTSSAAVAGLATFTSLSIASAGNYPLHATTTAAGVDAADSSSFQIISVVEDCSPSDCTAELGGVSLTGSPSSGSGFVLLSVNLGSDPLSAPGCADYVPPSGDYYEFQLFGVEGAKTGSIEYSRQAMKMRGPASLEICFAVPGPATFTAKDGEPAEPFDYDGDTANGAEGFAALLPNCPATPVAPCVLGRFGTTGGGAIITFFAPASLGDPRLH